MFEETVVVVVAVVDRSILSMAMPLQLAAAQCTIAIAIDDVSEFYEGNHILKAIYC